MKIRTSDLSIQVQVQGTPPSPPSPSPQSSPQPKPNEAEKKELQNPQKESTTTIESEATESDEAKNHARFSIIGENAWAGTFTVANLYYSHPILNILALEFHVSNERASLIPTVMQAGYAAGLFFLCPLGDVLKRRTFVLALVGATAILWLTLCLTNSFTLFITISFITALTTVTPQLMLPLVYELAPPHRRATSLAIVSSGLLLGLLFARLVSGILTQYTDWRAVYVLVFLRNPMDHLHPSLSLHAGLPERQSGIEKLELFLPSEKYFDPVDHPTGASAGFSCWPYYFYS
ncbi:hypothetical protein NHQ30_006984 [Ciborinia camelliae]|nr:hypothetical protein NHQ30_006984 [Ciborinia camelliae]